MRVALLTTCLAETFFPDLTRAARRVLEHFGCTVVIPPRQTCCGQPAFNSGFHEDARRVARHTLRVFAGFEHVVTASGSCATMLCESPELFADPDEHAQSRALAARTCELVTFLETRLGVDVAAELHIDEPVTVHYPCHARRWYGPAALVDLLRRAGCDVRVPEPLDLCCGFGGLFSIDQPEISAAMLEDRLASLRATGARLVVCNEPGCLLQLAGAAHRRGLGLRFGHIVELLAGSLGLDHSPADAARRAKRPDGTGAKGHVSRRSAGAVSGGRGRSLAQAAPGGAGLRRRAADAIADARQREAIHRATLHKLRARGENLAKLRDAEALRGLAAAIRQHAIENLPALLRQFVDQARARGATVHLARDAEAAREIIAGLARRQGVRLAVKSKSMATEEIGLNAALEAAGVRVVETDLGEFIVQLDRDRPSHIVTPIIHKTRGQVAAALVRETGCAYTEDPVELTRIARDHLRGIFMRAQMGISGANFLIAETGSVCICTNEGNGRMTVSLPRVHVVLAGVEKVIPRLRDLSVLLKLLARSSTGQPLTAYTTLISGPRRAGESDGPAELHIVLLDAGRSRILASDCAEILRCIRCGACLNACPVYRNIGGHAYGHTYSGPLGAVLAPLLEATAETRDLPRASSLCGACRCACPVEIDIPKLLVRLRRDAAGDAPLRRRVPLMLWRGVMTRPWLWRLARRLLPVLLRPDADGWVRRAPGPLAAWTSARDLPAPGGRNDA